MDRSNVAAIASLSRLVLNFRLIALLLTLLWIPHSEADLSLLSLALAGAGVLSLYPLLSWDRVAPTLIRYPALLGIDLVFAVWVLTITSPESPFVYYAIGTALLAGTLHGPRTAVLFSVLLIGGHIHALDMSWPVAGDDQSFHALIGLPAVYPMSAMAASAVRRMLIRQRTVEEALAERTRLAIAAEERSRLAREMHDSLTKTIHGIALSAAALPQWIRRDPSRAARGARALATAAERAASEARELIGDLRSDRLDAPLGKATERYVADWSETSGINAVTEVSEVGEVMAGSRYELFCILKEALRNVERHAHASQVAVWLRREGDEVTLTISDDGVGFVGISDLDALAASGHFGMVGMTERAKRVGGRLEASGHDGAGVSLAVTVPAQHERSYVAETPLPQDVIQEAV